jgi:hypothetical protein
MAYQRFDVRTEWLDVDAQPNCWRSPDAGSVWLSTKISRMQFCFVSARTIFVSPSAGRQLVDVAVQNAGRLCEQWRWTLV